MFAKLIEKKNKVLSRSFVAESSGVAVEDDGSLESAWELAKQYLASESCGSEKVASLSTDLAITSLSSLVTRAKEIAVLGPVIGSFMLFYRSYQSMTSNKEDFDEIRSRFTTISILIDSTATIQTLQKHHDIECEIALRHLCKAAVNCSNLVKDITTKIANMKRDSPSPMSSKFVEKTRNMQSFDLSNEDHERIVVCTARLNAAISSFSNCISEKRLVLYHIKELLQVDSSDAHHLTHSLGRYRREWLQVEFDMWFEQKAINEGGLKSNVMWLCSEAGMGKSTFAASLVETFRVKDAQHLLGHIFFNFNDPLKSDPLVVVKSLIYQAVQVFPELVDPVNKVLTTLQTELDSVDLLLDRVFLPALRKLERGKPSDEALLRKVHKLAQEIVPTEESFQRDPDDDQRNFSAVLQSMRRFFERSDIDHKGFVSEERFSEFLKRSCLHGGLTAEEEVSLTDRFKQKNVNPEKSMNYEKLIQALEWVEKNPKGKGSSSSSSKMDRDNVLLVIDAFDEAGGDNAEALKQTQSFVLNLIRKLPRWVKVLVTGRPSPGLTEKFQKFSYVVGESDPRHSGDVDSFIRDGLEQLFGANVDYREMSKLVSLLTEKSEGQYLYAAKMAEEICRSYSDDELRQGLDVKKLIEKAQTLPQGMAEYYSTVFKGVIHSSDEVNSRAHLLKVVAAREPLSEREMLYFLGLKTKEDTDYLKRVQNMQSVIEMRDCLNPEDGSMVKKFYPVHKSVIDWLTVTRKDSKFTVVKGHEDIAKRLLKRIEVKWSTNGEQVDIEYLGSVVRALHKNTEDSIRMYLFRHLLTHLDACSTEPVFQHITYHLLTSLAWLQCTLDLFGVHAVVAEYTKRVFSPAWLPGNPGAREDLKVLFQFLRLLSDTPIGLAEGGWKTEICVQITGRLRDLPQNQRLTAMVQEAEEYLRSHGGWLFHHSKSQLEQPGRALEMVLHCRDRLQSVVALPNGRLASDSDNVIRIWDAATGDCVLELSSKASCLAVLSSGLLATSLTTDSVIRLWSSATGRCEHTIDSSMLKEITGLCTLPDNQLACADSESILIMDTNTRQWIHSTSDSRPTHLCALSGHRLAYCSESQGEVFLRVYDYERGDTKSIPSVDNRAIEQMCVIADSKLVTKDSADIRVWDLSTFLSEVVVHDTHPCFLHPMRDGRLAVGGFDGVIRFWDTTTKECILKLSGHRGAVYALCSLPDGHMFSTSVDMTLRVWNLGKIPPPTPEQIEEEASRAAVVNVVCALSDGRVAVGCEDTFVRVWNPDSGDCEHVLKGHGYGVLYLLELCDGRLASGCFYEHNLRIWNVSSGECDLVLHSDTIRYICKGFCALDERHLASLDDCGSINVWNTRSGAIEFTIRGSGEGNCLLYLPKMDRLLCAQDKNILVYNLTSGHSERILKGHTDKIRWLYALHDGRIVSGSGDEKMLLWSADFSTSTVLSLDLSYSIASVYALPDGRLVSLARIERASGGVSMVFVWNVEGGFVETSFTPESPLSQLIQLLPTDTLCGVTGFSFHINDACSKAGPISQAMRLKRVKNDVQRGGSIGSSVGGDILKENNCVLVSYERSLMFLKMY